MQLFRRPVRRAALPTALLAILAAPAGVAEPLPADALPPALLAACDAGAAPYSNYALPVAAAAQALIDIGAFRRDEFAGARIGFCALRASGGPVATTSCAGAVILFDAKYERPEQALALGATLAHEALHHLQHGARKARYGADYCDSPRYAADRAALEAEADAFGDKVAGMLLLGRDVEIVNACDDPILVYLEANDPVAVRGAAASFQRIAAGSAAALPERARSGRVRFHAETVPGSGAPRIWDDARSAHARIVEGRRIRLKETSLFASDRADSPFRLTLSCAGGAR